MKQIKSLKFKVIGIVSILFLSVIVQSLSLDNYEKRMTVSITEALADDPDVTPAPENGTCCSKPKSVCVLKHVTVVNNYLKESLKCE